MKRSIFLAMLVIFAASFCSAQQPPMLPPDMVLPVPAPSVPAPEPASPPPAPVVSTPAVTPTPAPVVPDLPRAEPPKSIKIEDIIGRVESISLADAERGTSPEMVVIDDKGDKIAFIMIATTTIYDASWKRIALDKIKAGDVVKIKYMTTNEGRHEIRTINIAK